MKVVIINGAPGAGKDSFVTMCKDILGEKLVCNVSTVDFVKEVATFCGWGGLKTPESRKFLSDLKRVLTEWGNVPFYKTLHTIEDFADSLRDDGMYGKGVVFIHCREPEQIDQFVEEFDYSAVTLLVRRDAAESVEQINDSDNSVLNYSYDYTVYNNHSLSALRAQAEVFLREYLELNI